jgi:hypothetical protein
MPPNQIMLKPPRNRMPIEMQTTTPKAPRSGSSISSAPTSAIAAAIGMKPLVSLCMYCCLRTVKSAAYSTATTFMISDGCRLHDLQRQPAARAVDRPRPRPAPAPAPAGPGCRRTSAARSAARSRPECGSTNRPTTSEITMNRLAHQEVIVLAAQVGELGRIRQRDRGRIHHHHPEQHQQDHDPHQRLVVFHHARRPRARRRWRVADEPLNLKGIWKGIRSPALSRARARARRPRTPGRGGRNW